VQNPDMLTAGDEGGTGVEHTMRFVFIKEGKDG
jgi:hypothetical protein